MLLTGLAFLSDDVNIRTGLVMTGMVCTKHFWLPATVQYLFPSGPNNTLIQYLFTIMYSPGEGPVPFTYSAECHALHVRDLGMSLATSVTWTFNFILSFTWPAIDRGFKQTGSFGWYAAWNVIGFFMILL